jgi:large subunit ribosomal protein L3
MKFILGTKQDMTQLFDESLGVMVPVTKVTAGPCFVSQVKKQETDGVSAVQIALGTKKKPGKALTGHTKNIKANKYIKEFRVENDEKANAFNVGDVITAKQFEEGDEVRATGTSKGKGYAGVVKRHGFHGSPASHGHKDQLRMSGSIGATDPGHVFKGTRMSGHMGDERVTALGLHIVKVDKDTNTLFIKGAVPGARGGLILVTGDGDMTPEKPEALKTEKKEEVKEEKAETEGKS